MRALTGEDPVFCLKLLLINAKRNIELTVIYIFSSDAVKAKAGHRAWLCHTSQGQTEEETVA